MATDKELELERTSRARGFRFGLHEFFAELDLPRLRAENDRVEATYLQESSLLDRKTKELMIIAALVAQRGSVPHLQCHMHAAINAGASPEELMEMIDVIRNCTSSLAWLAGLEAWRVTFRPDIPTIDRVTDLR